MFINISEDTGVKGIKICYWILFDTKEGRHQNNNTRDKYQQNIHS